jgi:hypothetical protein
MIAKLRKKEKGILGEFKLRRDDLRISLAHLEKSGDQFALGSGEVLLKWFCRTMEF